MTRLLVCGDRDWKDRDYIFARLDEMQPLYGFSEMIEGCARGADRIGEEWATERGIPLRHFPANWDKWGKLAGIIRNTEMLTMGEPEMVVAFHTALQQSKGTKHMVTISKRAGVNTFVFPHSHEGYRKPEKVA